MAVIHRAALGRGPMQLRRFFQRAERQPRQRHCHSLTVCDPVAVAAPDYLRRSALGLVRIYNMLPERVVDTCVVKDFQSRLQRILRDRMQAGCEDWAATFCPMRPRVRNPFG